jgi:acyl-CoA thioester hydrolase
MLSEAITFRIPFYDIDSAKTVWHGNFIKYLEQGREAFGAKYGLDYLRIYDSGYVAPIAEMHLNLICNAGIADTIVVNTIYKAGRGAKIEFDYLITRESDGKLLLSASTTQLFVSNDGIFEVSAPRFYAEWKEKWKIIKV